MKRRIDSCYIQDGRMTIGDPVSTFIDAACAPLDASHASGTLERANALLAATPDLPRRSIHAAAILGDADAVRQHLAVDSGQALAKGGPRGWDPLTHLCFSRYLRLERSRTANFVEAATALLDAGASANTGWIEPTHKPHPEWESAIYGAAGVAHHPELTRLLLERGADPNDEETPYHAPETRDNSALKILVESSRLTTDGLATILLRKCDWHDADGIKWLLERGIDPNLPTRWGRTSLHQAILRDNDRRIIELLLEHGADPRLPATGPDRSRPPTAGGTAVAMAAWRGRGDLLALFEQRGVPVALNGLEHLLAACARHDGDTARGIAAQDPQALTELLASGGQLLATFAGVGNTGGVRLLLELGVPVDAMFEAGDGYFDEAANSRAIHVAAWRGRHDTLQLLIDRGSPVNLLDGHGRTPLTLAVRACVDSYWTGLRAPDSVRALLDAGASVEGVAFPSGYPAVDELLRPFFP